MGFLKKLFGSSESNTTGFGLTDKGRVRDNNEDYFAIAEDRNLFVVADGMGGHKAGEVASKMAVDSFIDYLSAGKMREIRKNPAAIQHTIITGFYKVNQDVMDEAARTKARRGMGCTLVICLVDGEWAYVAHVGDVRCYLYENGELCQVTKDHSTMTDMEYTVGGEQVHKKRNVVTMGIGFSFPEDPELHQIPTQSKGRLLLCSDGLWGMVDDKEIARILASDIPPQEACKQFVEQANNAGGKDNVTALVIQL
ncbi:MAG: serine/threonine-protein phosphatase [Desulfobulbaceae bacterium]|nr:serine/threonine-protein phosphatase [Desulfobulbaceae bacterium]